jgi:biopolymer transport protein ExbB/TolQ
LACADRTLTLYIGIMRKDALAVSRFTSFPEWLLRQPIIWGSLACLAFYATVVRSASQGSFLDRYFASHEVEYLTTALFFIGMAALILKLIGLIIQLASRNYSFLADAPADGQPVQETGTLLEQLDEAPAALQSSYLMRRLRETLEYVRRKNSADTLEQHLRYQEEVDLARMHHSYATVRVIVATIPILGFLGTVIGITLAIAKLSGESMDQQLPAVISGLSVAFDTTALALSLSIALLFLKFVVERIETNLLAEVDTRTTELFLGRFRQYGTNTDPHLASVSRMSENVLETVRSASQEQSRYLAQSLDRANMQWAGLATSLAKPLEQTFSEAITKGLKAHAEGLNQGVIQHAQDLEETLIRHAELLNEGLGQHTAMVTEAEQLVAKENRRHLADVEAAVGEAMLVATDRQEKLIQQAENLLKEMQVALVEAAGTTVAQQEQLIKQGDILLKVVEATGQVQKLEDVLNSNLAALAGSHHFEQTVTSLSATLQLLSVQLGQPIPSTDAVHLTDPPASTETEASQAA